MHIWVDADACPKVIKDILFRAATRTKIPLTLVANQTLHVPPSPFIRSVQVPAGFKAGSKCERDHKSTSDAEATTNDPVT